MGAVISLVGCFCCMATGDLFIVAVEESGSKKSYHGMYSSALTFSVELKKFGVRNYFHWTICSRITLKSKLGTRNSSLPADMYKK